MTPLEARLARLAATGQSATYGQLARELGLRIGELTGALETLMEADAAKGLPLRAALVDARLTPGYPAKGFFDKALALGFEIPDEAAFVRAQRQALSAR